MLPFARQPFVRQTYRGGFGDTVVPRVGSKDALISLVLRDCWVMTNRIRLSIALCSIAVLVPQVPRLYAQCCDTCYRMVCKTVCEDRQVTYYKPVCETVMETREISRQVPTYETEMRERRFKVLRPITETAMREERYTVQRPTYETVMRDTSYNVVRNIVETSEREERYMVQKPVCETSMREERYVVQRPVTETAYQPQVRTVMRPVTQCNTRYVDQGCYVDQVACTPATQTLPGLAWQPATQVVDPRTGIVQVQRGGLAWTTGYVPPQQVVQRVWRPNVVAQQYNTVSYCPEQVTEQVPGAGLSHGGRGAGPSGTGANGSHDPGRGRSQSAGSNLPPGCRTRAAAGSGPSLPHGHRRASPPGAGDDLPHG